MQDLLKDVIAEAVNLLPEIVFNKGSKVQRALMALYASLIEQADSALTLLSANKHPGVDIVLRASLEAYVDLINLANDDRYFDQMRLAYHEDSVKLLDEGVSKGNTFMDSFQNNPEMTKSLAEHRAELDILKKTVKPLNIGERFTLAGMNSVYRSIYRVLCTESHNNVRALMSRHFRFDSGDVELVIFDAPRETDRVASLDGFITVLVGATSIIHNYFETNGRDAVKALQDKRAACYDEHYAPATGL
ncbi:hypothetical protein ELH67_33030 (plasmid) [Rhizobium ruizarguesonis]|uniref:DUF5677 domain-containing protein n=1 Tax=Rhizobium TaxID=379 RepID=UPI0003607E69|nr:DUF5677 domain-containing protein [Rhizobium ruizarguesonis]TAZ86928.1 hypothetical protein ELH67_33030 [Rhizobium ruizarguesonis]TBA32445.1 hypothetical protein ELH60_28485 [Rhizobium ruizarguesonis]TBC53326.1 hypothetical protein ELH36_34535 [Rhizobium ruizarguesonis]